MSEYNKYQCFKDINLIKWHLASPDLNSIRNFYENRKQYSGQIRSLQQVNVNVGTVENLNSIFQR